MPKMSVYLECARSNFGNVTKQLLSHEQGGITTHEAKKQAKVEDIHWNSFNPGGEGRGEEWIKGRGP
ncbi:expressed protein [Echinococcus multilocularis]|uniref:Expressed protein n=1 Tax=Echinococcus multilocularis TaxID=6211 RepID=A0A068Y8K1_ECHMU|nr:expressed protein [Echinococcus multilocularis]